MIEKILERLEAKKKEYLEAFRTHGDNERYGIACGFGDSIKIVQEVAKEYGKDTNVPSNWIPTAEMLFPRYGQNVLASVRTDVATHEVIITTYERQEYWHNGIITAWQPLPAPFKKGE